MLYVTNKTTQVSGNPDKTIPEGIAVDVVQVNDGTLTLASGDWIDVNDADAFTETVNASGDLKISIDSTKSDSPDKTTMLLSSIGALGGLYYAFSTKRGFWGYVGFFVLGSIAGSLAGKVVTSITKK